MLTHGPAAVPTLYLSFDDGPDPEHTPRILDLLAAHGAHASFFLIGEHAERHPRLVERLVAEGHLIGNHSYSHPRFGNLALSAQIEEITRTEHILSAFDGLARHRFRPPYGVLPARLVAHCAMQRRNIAFWSFDSLDYQERTAEELVAMLRAQPPRTGDIVLMHDDRAHTVELLEVMLPQWRAQGFRLDALPALDA